MKKNENIALISGDFKPEEAKELLLTLINHKINYHERKSFSSEIRLGDKDKHSGVRIEQLRASKSQINALIEEAAKKGLTLKIDSVISIELSE